MGYIKNILLSIDQLGNAISGGNPDATISGRIGYFANHTIPATRWFWIVMQFIVDVTFWPLDGKGHCHQAYHNDECEDYSPARLGLGYFIFSVITVLSCLCLIIPFYLSWIAIKLIKFILPKY